MNNLVPLTLSELKTHIGDVLVLRTYRKDKIHRKKVETATEIILYSVNYIYASSNKLVEYRLTGEGNLNTFQTIEMSEDGFSVANESTKARSIITLK